MGADGDPEEGVRVALERLRVPYERLECDPAAADTAVFCARYGVPPERSANTILVASKKEPPSHAACVVRASMLLDVNRTVRRLMGVPRLSFASAEETARLTGMRVGGVTPFNLPAGMPIYIDEGLLALDWIIVGGGGRSSKIKLAPQALLRLPGAQVVPGLARERPQ